MSPHYMIAPGGGIPPGNARRIRGNHRSLTGRVPSQKSGEMLAFESALERDALILFDFDPSIDLIRSQPVTINHAGGRYTPDVFVRFVDRTRKPAFFEIKYLADFFAQLPYLRPHLRAALRDFRDLGCTFHVLTEDHIRTPRLTNVKRLWRFRSWSTCPRDCESVVQLLRERPGFSPSDILQTMVRTDNDREVLLATIWHLVSIGSVRAEMDSELLTNSSSLWVT